MYVTALMTQLECGCRGRRVSAGEPVRAPGLVKAALPTRLWPPCLGKHSSSCQMVSSSSAAFHTTVSPSPEHTNGRTTWKENLLKVSEG